MYRPTKWTYLSLRRLGLALIAPARAQIVLEGHHRSWLARQMDVELQGRVAGEDKLFRGGPHETKSDPRLLTVSRLRKAVRGLPGEGRASGWAWTLQVFTRPTPQAFAPEGERSRTSRGATGRSTPVAGSRSFSGWRCGVTLPSGTLSLGRDGAGVRDPAVTQLANPSCLGRGGAGSRCPGAPHRGRSHLATIAESWRHWSTCLSLRSP